MRLLKSIYAMAICGMLATSQTGLVLAADPMGSVVAVEGRPSASGANGARVLSEGSEVFEGDTITVGDGNAQMQLDDGTKLVVGPSSRLLLQAYLRRNSNTASKVGLKALRGTFRVITGKSPKSAYKISTNNATIGIRGTGFDFTVRNRTVLAVLTGSVRLTGRNGQAVGTAKGCGVIEAGSNQTKATELQGTAKANALKNELPYATNQNELNRAFHLPIQTCLTALGSSESAPGATQAAGVQAAKLLPLIPAAAIPAVIFATKEKDSISPETAPFCNPQQISPPCG